MDKPLRSRSDWTLTKEAFAKFLACLDPDRDRAAETYEVLRLKLIKFFDWRGAHFPEECVDETFNRVARKVDGGEVINNIATYCHGIARMILLEKLRDPDHQRISLDELSEAPAVNPWHESTDFRRQCFEQCLDNLASESRLLILEYYRDERRSKIENRRLLARKLGIPLHALRNRAQRVRERLERCVIRCVKRK